MIHRTAGLDCPTGLPDWTARPDRSTGLPDWTWRGEPTARFRDDTEVPVTDDPVALALGLALLALGAVGATVTQRGLDAGGRGRFIAPALVPFGVLIGAGASLIRGWDLVGSVVAGAVLVPLVAVVGRLVEVRRRQRRDHG